MEGDAQKPHPTPEEKPPDAPAAEPELGTYARFQNIIRELPKYRASTLVTYVTRRFTRDSCPSVASALSYTSLLAMVAAMPRSRTNSDEEKAILQKASTQLAPVRTRLIELVDEDSRAYEAVVAAYRLPKTTDDDKAARKAAVQGAMLEASEVPLAVMRCAASG